MTATVTSVTPTTDSGGSTSHIYDLPAAVNSGDLLILIVGSRFNEPSAVPQDSTSDNWTALFDDDDGTYSRKLGCWLKISDGDENGGTVTLSTNDTATSKGFVIRISASSWFGDLAGVEGGTFATGTDDVPDPPSLTASWGSADNLFIAVCQYSTDFNNFSSYPTNYSGSQNDLDTGDDTGNDTGLAMATRDVTGATDNPGTFGLSASAHWMANTIVVRPTSASLTALTATPKSGFTEVGDSNSIDSTYQNSLETQFKDGNDTTPSVTWSASGDNLAYIAIEIGSSGAAASTTGTLAVTEDNDTVSALGTLSTRNEPAYATPLVPRYWTSDVDHRARISDAVNQALRGKLNNTGTVTLTPSTTTTVINHPSIGVFSFIQFTPESANAAAEIGAGTMYISARGDQTATITHASNAQTDRHFTYVVIG